VERAVSKGIAVLPFRIADVPLSKSLEYFITSPHWLDAPTPPLERHVEKLAGAVRALLAHDVAAEPVRKEPPLPPRPAPSPRGRLAVLGIPLTVACPVMAAGLRAYRGAHEFARNTSRFRAKEVALRSLVGRLETERQPSAVLHDLWSCEQCSSRTIASGSG
jgi:hypothetical protein